MEERKVRGELGEENKGRNGRDAVREKDKIKQRKGEGEEKG